MAPTRNESDLKSYKGLKDRWWQFWNHREKLLRRLRRHQNFIAISKNTTYPFGVIADHSWTYTNKVVLIGVERGDEPAICLSSFFRYWLTTYSGGRLRGWLTISISQSIGRFPLPIDKVNNEALALATQFDEALKSWTRKFDTVSYTHLTLPTNREV